MRTSKARKHEVWLLFLKLTWRIDDDINSGGWAFVHYFGALPVVSKANQNGWIIRFIYG